MNDHEGRNGRLLRNEKQQQQIDEIINELQVSQNINTFFVLSKFLDCHQIKNEVQFFQILFNDHLQVILQIIQWMLIPKNVIRKKKINVNKTNIDSYPYQCRQLLKDNWCFYQQLYSYSKNKKIQFSIWFNFLRKQYFDKQTIYTALGYFSDVMIPFAKCQFNGLMNLTQSLQMTSVKKVQQPISIIKILPQFLIDQLIKYCHFQPIFTFLKTAILVGIEDSKDYQISKTALLKILRGVQIKNLFSKFPIPNQVTSQEIAKNMDYLENISNCFKEISQNVQSNSEASFRIIAIISVIVESGIIKYIINQLVLSKLCRLSFKQRDRLHTCSHSFSQTLSVDSSQHSYSAIQLGSSQNININVYNLSPLPQLGSFGPTVDADEQELAEVMFRILQTIVEIFVKVPRSLIASQDENMPNSQGEIAIQQNIVEGSWNNGSQSQTLKQKLKAFTFEQFEKIILEFQEQMQYLLDNMQILTKFVYNEVESGVKSTVSKIIPFASGENVKAISFMKYQYFKLVYNVLIMVQCKDQQGHECGSQSPLKENKEIQNETNRIVLNRKSPQKQMKEIKLNKRYSKQLKDPPTLKKQYSKQTTKQQSKSDKKSVKLKFVILQPFQLKVQKLQIIQIIKKYLNDNRWNNIAHHLLQKITHSLIMCSYDYIKKNIERDKNKKFSQTFLAFLIQSFTKRDFVFLTTVKFTSQGNLHSLYNIAKDLAYTLNSTNQLAIFLNEFEPWKKFIMNDLKNYEEKIYPAATKPEQCDQDEDDLYTNLKVDEADSIKKLIGNISETKKWPKRLASRSKSLSKGNIMDLRGSGELFIRSSMNVENKKKLRREATNSKQKLENDLKEKQKNNIENYYQNNGLGQIDIEAIYMTDKIQESSRENDDQF